VVNHLKIQHLSHSSLYGLNSWITKLQDLVAVDANQVIVLLKPIGFFKLRKIFSKLVFGHQITFHQ
jgi:hypothetical protein